MCACAAAAALAMPVSAGALPETLQRASGTERLVPLSERPDAGAQREYLDLVSRARREGADPGKNILFNGVDTGDGEVRAPTEGELDRSVGVLRRMVGSTGGSEDGASAPGGALQQIAACESHGNPSAVGGGGAYRGKYQFDYGTWQSVGGSGDPAAAPEAEQDRRAAMLLARDGAGHWPNCG
jgi:hypothetical protein